MIKDVFRRLHLFTVQHQTASSFAAAFVVYGLCTLFYMGGAATNCTQSLLTFPGDNTAGLIALFSADSHSPWFGHTDIFSYPYGESLWQPTQVTAQVLFIPFWVLAKLFGPICSFNLLCIIGFMSAALVTFAFIRWLLGGRTLVALIAGFAVAFTPYLQLKTGVHISYVFEGMLVATTWFFLLFWRSPNWRRAALLGVSVALLFYVDGYFILLGGVLAGALVVSAALYEFFKAGQSVDATLLKRLKLLLVSILTVLVVASPVAYVSVISSRQISANLTVTRDSIKREAQVYGARPAEYFLPNAFNPLGSRVFGAYAQRDNHGSNSAENVLSLSWTLLVLAALFVVQVVRAMRGKTELRVTNLRMNPLFLLVVFGALFVIALLCSLPPKFGQLPMPSDVIIHVTAFWRVFARLYVVVNIGLVALASLGLAWLLGRFRRQSERMLVCILVFLLIFIEYLTFAPTRPVGSYQNVPQLYYWLHTQSAYADIAEYPLDEFAASGYPVFYNTYQRIDGKHLLNGIISNQDAISARSAVRDLLAPQAVPGLRTLGIDFVTIHANTSPGDIPGLRLVYRSPEPILGDTVWGYAVEPGDVARYVVVPVRGFHAPIKVSAIHQLQEVGHDGVLALKDLSGHSAQKRVTVAFMAKAFVANGQEVSITQDGIEIWRGIVPVSWAKVDFDADPHKDVHILPVNPTTDATLWLSDFNAH